MVTIRQARPVQNRHPLKPAPFLRLPPGSVRPRGWLQTQLTRQLDGLHGQLPHHSPYLNWETSGWINPNLSGGEELPLWLRGYVSLAFATRDAAAINQAKRWIDGILATQTEDGYFGPQALRSAFVGGSNNDNAPSPWCHLPLLHALRTYEEYTGDQRIVPFIFNFLSFLYKATARDTKIIARPSVASRWADAIDTIYWTYNRTEGHFLLGLVERIHHHANKESWSSSNTTTTTTKVPSDGVDLAISLSEPALYSVLSGQREHAKATYTMYDDLVNQYGQFPGGGFAADSHCRPGFADPRQGFNVSALVELMRSHETLTRVTGDAKWADRVEELAFNNLTAAVDPTGKAIHVINSANSIAQLDRPCRHDQFADGGEPLQSYKSLSPNSSVAHRQCAHNYGQGWPGYLEEMWLAHSDGGIVANLHGPSELQTLVGGDDGDNSTPTRVSIVAEGSYPFSESIIYTVHVSKQLCEFALHIRTPAWCDTTELALPDGTVVYPSGSARYIKVHRAWSSNDRVVVRFPMAARTHVWPATGAVSVYFGPQAFSLALAHEWRDTCPETRELRTASPWNYGLAYASSEYLTVTRSHGLHADPWTPETSPLKITTRAQRVPEWTADADGVVRPLQHSPVRADGPVERVMLVPMGAARVRIAVLPLVGAGVRWVAPKDEEDEEEVPEAKARQSLSWRVRVHMQRRKDEFMI